MELQTDLSKFYRPITETQKATVREITEGLKPIKEGIEKLPQAMQPIGEATGKAPEEEEEENEELETEGQMARVYLNRPDYDTTFGIRKKKGHHYIGVTHVIIHRDNIVVDNEKFRSTPGLWELITAKNLKGSIGYEDMENYKMILLKTNVLYHNNDPSNPRPKSSDSDKWKKILNPIWYGSKKVEGEGVVVIPSDPNALLERLDLLLSSQEAGNTGVGNELVSICDELKRQGVLDTKAYKKLNSIIKK